MQTYIKEKLKVEARRLKMFCAVFIVVVVATLFTLFQPAITHFNKLLLTAIALVTISICGYAIFGIELRIQRFLRQLRLFDDL